MTPIPAPKRIRQSAPTIHTISHLQSIGLFTCYHEMRLPNLGDDRLALIAGWALRRNELTKSVAQIIGLRAPGKVSDENPAQRRRLCLTKVSHAVRFLLHDSRRPTPEKARKACDGEPGPVEGQAQFGVSAELKQTPHECDGQSRSMRFIQHRMVMIQRPTTHASAPFANATNWPRAGTCLSARNKRGSIT